jgi:hypothetical protein
LRPLAETYIVSLTDSPVVRSQSIFSARRLNMRLGRTFILDLCLVTLFCTPGTTQDAAHAAPAAPASPKKTPAKTPAAKPPATKKFLLKIYSIPPACITPAFYSSSASAAPSQTAVAPPPAAPANGPAPTCHDDSQLPVPSSTSAADIVKALASDSSYSSYDFVALGSDKIAIYKKDTPPDPKKGDPRFTEIEKAIDAAAASPSLQYLRVMHVTRGFASQAAALVNALSAGSITATPLDGDNSSILLQSKTVPGKTLLAYLDQRIAALRQPLPTPPTQRLFHLDASAVVKNLAPSGASAPEKDSSEKDSSEKPSPDKPAPGKGSKKPAPASPDASKPDPKQPADASDDDDSSSNDKTSDASDDSKPAAKSTPAPADSLKPPDMRAVNDTIVYSNDDGSDRGIFERTRLMAVLDLPRPEVLLNLWSLQASSRDYHVTNAEAEAVHVAVAQHNQVLQDAIDEGWSFLSQQMQYKPQQSGFFSREFYNYIVQKFALNPNYASEKPEEFKRIKDIRRSWGWCNPDTYCLGFTHAFEPLRPTFTNILLSIIAANNPAQVAQETIQHMEGDCPPNPSQPVANPFLPPLATAADEWQVGNFRQCLSDHTREIQTAKAENGGEDCELQDRLTLASQVLASRPERLQLSCFKQQARTSFQGGPGQTTRVGLLRAAVADFLFNYKWSIQYPHDFVPYDLSQSAQELNAELNPLILAFNRDVAAFTESLQNEMECKYNSTPHPGWFGGGDEAFLNDGMIAVRGISGVESIVDTITQSYFDATKPPNLTDLVKSVSDAEKNIPGVLKTNLTANEAAVLLGALNSVQPTQARIGRQLKIDITPHALAGASSAELDVKLTAEEAGSPTLYTSGKSSDDTLSRVATHDTTTKVRVESLKLFEVSAFSAMLQRPRSKFPLLPPFFEVPYFASFISVPIPGARIYHRSSAIVSAVIVPTAADLAYGIDFTDDRVCRPPVDSSTGEAPPAVSNLSYPLICEIARSPYAFDPRPLRGFNKAMVQCLATEQRAPETGTQATDLTVQEKDKDKDDKDKDKDPNAPKPLTCASLSFTNIPPGQ